MSRFTRPALRMAVVLFCTIVGMKTQWPQILESSVYDILNVVEWKFYELKEEMYQNMTKYFKPKSKYCTLPIYDPFHKSILKFIYNMTPVSCGRPQPYLTYVDGDGYIHINNSGAHDAGLKKGDLECSYAEFQRLPNTDNNITYGKPHTIRDSVKLSTPFVKTWCVSQSNGKPLYEMVHAWVNPLSKEQESRVQPATSERPSVLIFAVDSMSRLNFIRQMSRTHALITETFGATIFTGMVRLGVNTLPNIIPMLTGMAAKKDPNFKPVICGEIRECNAIYGKNGTFDDLPLLWKNFSENGYVTMYAEDSPEFANFNLHAKGFVKVPTDYYMRPFWLLMNHVENFRSSDNRCYGNFPKYEYLFNYTREFVEKMRDKRYFAFSFLTGYSHGLTEEAQVIDEPFHALLEGLWQSGALKNTVVLVLSDHGNRFDPIRATVLGRVEERMPYLSITLPPALRAARPYLEEGLRNNNATFISWYDVYELLADIALDNLQPAPRVARFGQLGWSLFRPVPQRTCPQAGVSPEHCVCVREVMLPTQDVAVWEAGRALVAHVNAMLAARAQSARACAPLTLSDVLSAQMLLPNWWLSSPEGFTAEVRVAVRVAPSDALLEGTVERDAWELQGRVKGDVARINKYANQSHCVSDRILRLYCYCTDLLPRPPPPPPQQSPPAA